MADQCEVRAEVSGMERNPIWTNTTLVFVINRLKDHKSLFVLRNLNGVLLHLWPTEIKTRVEPVSFVFYV